MNFLKNKNFRDFDLAFVDTESTGIGMHHDIVEIGVIRVSAYNFSILDEWEVRIKPESVDKFDPEALKIVGYTEDDWKDAIGEEEAIKEFLKKTENTILVGHNLTWDWILLHKTLKKYGLDHSSWYKSLDTFTLAWEKLRKDTSIKSFGLEELSRYFGITQDRPHRALSDAKTTYEVFLKLISL